MKENNKAFSLVELIVAISMFAIVGAMIFSIVVISSRTYKNVSAEVDVQEEAQLTLNQIKDLVIDTNRAVAYGLEVQDPSNMKSFIPIDETNTYDSIIHNQWAGVDEASILRVLVIYNEKGCNTIQADGSVLTTYTYPIIKIIFDKSKGEVFYAEYEFPDVTSIDISTFGIINTNDVYLLSEYVSEFNVDLANIENSQVDLQVRFSSSPQGVGRECFLTPTINLRNKVIVSENKSEIYINNAVDVNSFVSGIHIKKDGLVINEDTIQLGNSMTYTAEVDAEHGASDAYVWELTGSDSSIPSTVTGTGVVTVPSNEYSGTLTLTAVAVGDSTKTVSIPITILNLLDLEASIEADTTSISRGEEVEFTARVSNFVGEESNLKYNWEIIEYTGFVESGIKSSDNIELFDQTSKNVKVEVNKNLDWSSEFKVKLKVTVSEVVGGTERSIEAIPVELSISKVKINVDEDSITTYISKSNWYGYYFTQEFNYTLENITLSDDEFRDDLTRSFSYSGEGLYYIYSWSWTTYSWIGTENPYTFEENEDISYWKENTEKNTGDIKTAIASSYFITDKFTEIEERTLYITRLEYKFTISYGTDGNTVTYDSSSIYY